jgi:hypothetical protein
MGEREMLTVSCHSYVHFGFRRCDIPHSQFEKFSAATVPRVRTLLLDLEVMVAPLLSLASTASDGVSGKLKHSQHIQR